MVALPVLRNCRHAVHNQGSHAHPCSGLDAEAAPLGTSGRGRVSHRTQKIERTNVNLTIELDGSNTRAHTSIQCIQYIHTSYILCILYKRPSIQYIACQIPFGRLSLHIVRFFKRTVTPSGVGCDNLCNSFRSKIWKRCDE